MGERRRNEMPALLLHTIELDEVEQQVTETLGRRSRSEHLKNGGYFTWEAYSLVDYPTIMLGMITIGVLGLTCSGIIRLFGVVMMPWLAFAPGGKR